MRQIPRRAPHWPVHSLSSLKKLRFRGTLEPEDCGDWRLDAARGATVVQPCDITLDPVTTQSDDPVRRRYVTALGQVEPPDEQEMPEDVDEEPLPATLDLEALMIEALSLAISPFPRSEAAEFGKAVYTEPGAKLVRDKDTRPVAALKDALRLPQRVAAPGIRDGLDAPDPFHVAAPGYISQSK